MPRTRLPSGKCASYASDAASSREHPGFGHADQRRRKAPQFGEDAVGRIDIACIDTPRLESRLMGDVERAPDVEALRDDQQLRLMKKIARPQHRRTGAKALIVAQDRFHRYATLDQPRLHCGRLVVALADASATHQQDLDLARLPECRGSVEAIDQIA